MFYPRKALAALLIALSASTSACKLFSSDSKVKTISSAELEACGKFNGDRLMLTIMPTAAFAKDGDLAQKDFVASMSNSTLTGFSYFQNAQGQISAPCRLYASTDQAKYNNFANLTAEGANRQGITDALQALGKKIGTLRQLNTTDGYEIQVMVAISSHGGNLPNNPDGVLVLGDSTTMPFSDLAGLIKTNLLTVCPDDACTALDAKESRKADEVMLLTDTCFSGRFNVALQSALAQTPGYGTNIAKGTSSHASRVLSFVSTGIDTTAPGQYVGTKNSLLFQALHEMITYWEGDANKDNALSMAEVRDALTKDTLPGALQEGIMAFDTMLLKPLICTDSSGSSSSGFSSSSAGARTTLLNTLNINQSALQNLFDAPVRTLETQEIAEVSIAVPSLYTNLQDDYLKVLMLAVGGKNSAAKRTGLSEDALEKVLVDRTALLKKIYTVVSAQPSISLSRDTPGLDLTGPELTTVGTAAPNCFSGATGSSQGSSASTPNPSP